MKQKTTRNNMPMFADQHQIDESDNLFENRNLINENKRERRENRFW